MPTQTGRWSGDLTYLSRFYPPEVAAQRRPCHYGLSTRRPTAPAAGSISSDLWYLIDLAPYQSDIATGHAILWAAALFNRYLDYAYTDTQCEIEVSAYAGTPDTFPTQLDHSELASVTVDPVVRRGRSLVGAGGGLAGIARRKPIRRGPTQWRRK